MSVSTRQSHRLRSPCRASCTEYQRTLMAIYAIGDLQGCYDPFRRLLDEIDFEPANDSLWLTGDLVNRGPKSLKTLRYVKKLGGCVVTVLGNHDLHFLALSQRVVRNTKRFESLQKLLRAPDLIQESAKGVVTTLQIANRTVYARRAGHLALSAKEH